MKYADMKSASFADELASAAPTPGGGGASALTGALGICLGNMVGSLTVGKKKYADVEDDVKRLMNEAQKLKGRFIELIDEDAAAFEPLAKAYGIPKDDPERDAVMEEALDRACKVPLEIMHTCCTSLDLIREFAAKGSQLAISDAGCGAVVCKSALMAASLNVFINTKAMKDRDKAAATEKEAHRMLDEYCRIADEVFSLVTDRIAG